jgi:hypothetical protein
MLHVEDVFKQRDIIYYYYYTYRGCNACKLAQMHLCMCCVDDKLNMDKIATSGGPFYGASSPFSKVVHIRNLKP